MILFLLPACHFALAVLTLGLGKWRRSLFALGVAVDLSLAGLLLVGARGGAWPSVVLGGWTRSLGIELSFDLVAAAFLVLAVLLESAILAYLWRGRQRAILFALLHALFASIFALLFTRDIFNIYVILELLTLISFLLVGYDRRPAQIWASLKYLVLTSFGMSLFLLGIAVLYRHTGTLNLVLLAELLGDSPPAAWKTLAGSLLITGVAVKAGVFTFALWLPTAHAEAPTVVSAVLSGLVVKMGVVVLLRLRGLFDVTQALQMIGSTTCIAGALYAACARDLKRLLAFSTLSQIGYIILGLSVGAPSALVGTLAYALAHGLFKGLLFLAGGDAVGSVGSRRIAQLITERARIPRATRCALLLGSLGIVGLPPLAGFTAKALLFAGELPLALEIVLIVTSIGTAFAFAKLLPLLGGIHSESAGESHVVSYVSLAIPILGFAPLVRLGMPSIGWHAMLEWRVLIESVAAIGAGILLHRCVRHRRVSLPDRLFRLEEGMLTVLIGFFVIFLLSRLG